MTTLLLAAAAFAVTTLVLSRPGYVNRFVGLATPRPLAILRILSALMLIYYLLLEDLPRVAGLPEALVRHQELAWFLHGTIPALLQELQGSATALRVLQLVAVAMAVLALVGWRSRVSVPLSALLAILCGAILRQYIGWAHLGVAAIYVMIALTFFPCADAWSLDRRRALKNGGPVADLDTPTERNGWALYAVWAMLCLVYVCAGLSKLRARGLDWWDAANMKVALLKPVNLYPSDWQFGVNEWLARLPDGAFAVMGILGLACELLFLLVLWFRWARWLMPASMIGMHLVLWATKRFLFLDCVLLLVAMSITAAVVRPGTRPGGSPAAAPPTCWRLAGAALVAAILVGQGVIWTKECERYPATGFQMYAEAPEDGKYLFHRVIIHQASGRSFHGCLAGADRSYFDNRLMKRALILALAPSPGIRAAARSYLERVVRDWNHSVAAEERIVRFDAIPTTVDTRRPVDSPRREKRQRKVTFLVGPEGGIRPLRR